MVFIKKIKASYVSGSLGKFLVLYLSLLAPNNFLSFSPFAFHLRSNISNFFIWELNFYFSELK